MLLIVLIFAVSGFAQTIKTQHGNALLTYRISLQQIDREAKTIVFAVRIVNMNPRTVVIDKNALRYQVEFTRKGKHFADGGIGPSEAWVRTGDPGPSYQPETIKLSPRQTYRNTATFSLDDSFFNDGEVFSLALTYGFFRDHQGQSLPVIKGTFSSNEVEFTYRPRRAS
jgi:hypothetical protein